MRTATWLSTFWLSLGVVFADSLFLTMPKSGAQFISSGSSIAGGSDGIWYNPAAAIAGSRNDLSLTYHNAGNDLILNSIAATYHISPDFGAALSVAALYFQTPLEQKENYEDSGSSLPFSDTSASVSFGYRIFPDLSAGISLRYFRMQLGNAVGQGIGTDLGLRYAFNLPGLERKYRLFSYSLSVSNLGPDFQYYHNGSNQSQPLQITTGIGAGLPRWGVLSFDYSWSMLDDSLYTVGLAFTRYSLIQPMMGFQYGYAGPGFSAATQFSFGQTHSVSVMAGMRLSGVYNGTEYFVSAKYSIPHQFGEVPAIPASNPPVVSPGLYKPFVLVPHSSKFNAEKTQGILLRSESAAGYRQEKYLLRTVALQPEDEKYFGEMASSGKNVSYLTGRTMGVWLYVKLLDPQKEEIAQEIISAALESNSNTVILTGEDLSYLNKNPNAPLRVEWKIVVEEMQSGSLREIRTRVEELYAGTSAGTHNVRMDEREDLAHWKELGEYYATLFSGMDSFYKLEIINAAP